VSFHSRKKHDVLPHTQDFFLIVDKEKEAAACQNEMALKISDQLY